MMCTLHRMHVKLHFGDVYQMFVCNRGFRDDALFNRHLGDVQYVCAYWVGHILYNPSKIFKTTQNVCLAISALLKIWSKITMFNTLINLECLYYIIISGYCK